MTSTYTKFQCDECGNRCHEAGLVQNSPINWFELTYRERFRLFLQTKHFCSANCLSLWITKFNIKEEKV